MKRRLISLSAITVVGSSLVLAGCGSTTTSTGTQSALGNAAVVGLPAQVSPNWWFPIEASTSYSVYNNQVNMLMYKPLLQISKTDGIDYAQSLASKVTWNSAGTVYTISLNPKWHWSNGSPVTAADVVYSTDLMLYASSGNQSLPWGYGGAGIGGLPTQGSKGRWQSVVAEGKHTVVVTLTTPSNPQWFLHNGLGQIVPIPKSVWDIHQNMSNELTFIKNVSNTPSASYYNVVDGPFKYAPSQSKPNNQYWTFVPNPQYDGHKASISKLVYEYETSSSAEFAALKTGKINVGYLPPSLYTSRAQLAGDKIAVQYPFGFNYMVPNLNSKAPGGFGQIMSHRYARLALEMGINQKGMIQSFFHGYGVTEYGPIPSKPRTQFFLPSLKNPAPFNPAAGKALLQKHGWHLVNGVMTNAQGQKFEFTFDYVSGSNTLKDEVQLMKQDWAQEGIVVNLVSQPFNTLIANTSQSDPTAWQLNAWGGGWTYEPDYYPTGGGLFASGSAANYGDYVSSTMNRLVQSTYAPGTNAQISQRMNAYQTYAAQQLPVIWLPWTAQFSANATNMKGVNGTFNPITDLMTPNYWTISK